MTTQQNTQPTNPTPPVPQNQQGVTNQVAPIEGFKTSLVKITDTYTNMIVNAAKSINIEYSNYQKVCVANAIAKMQELLVKEGLTIKDVDSTNLTNTLQQIAMLQLNTAAVPRECYLILRNIKAKNGDYLRQFEFGIEGDGNDAILRAYGVDIEKVHTVWIVREGDEFTYPSFSGLEITPPKWVPKSYTGRVARVVYPVAKTDGTVEYHIAERESVIKNILAHISNNMMNETFGIAENRFKASKEQLEQIDNKKQELLNLANGKSLDAIFEIKELQKWISPAWLALHSREDMILRKLRNNAVKKIPKNFQNAFAALEYEKTYDDYDQYRRQPQVDPEDKLSDEIDTGANKEPLKATINVMDDAGNVKPTEAEIVDKKESPTPQEQPKSNGKPTQRKLDI